MAHEPVVIPEKIYFKIGEVCDLVGVQAHVLRYWETEFSSLSPQKNKSGQRTYRKRDVEIALRIKELLYNEMFTIAGARKKIQTELRDANRSKSETAPPPAPSARVEKPAPKRVEAPTLFDNEIELDLPELQISESQPEPRELKGGQKEAIKVLAGHLLELRELLKSAPSRDAAGSLTNG